MLDRLGGFVFALYFVFVGSAVFAIVSAFSFAAGVTERNVGETKPKHLSKAEAQIQSDERSATRRSVTPDLIVPSAPKISATALAKGLDDAEGRSGPPNKKPHLAHRARVAGWVRHQDHSHPHIQIKESTGRIILRSLFAQNGGP